MPSGDVKLSQAHHCPEAMDPGGIGACVPQLNFSVAGGLSASRPPKPSRNGREAICVHHLGANEAMQSVLYLAKSVGMCCFSPVA